MKSIILFLVFLTTVFVLRAQEKKDTIPAGYVAVNQYDTVKASFLYTHAAVTDTAFRTKGFIVRQKYVYNGLRKVGQTYKDHWKFVVYLSEEKKKFGQSIIVWEAKLRQ